jgi:3-hydroxyisobutyrate dehydrogenase
MAQVAVLGMGAMGTRIAKRLAGAGHALSVWNRTAERSRHLEAIGARVAEAPKDAVAGADIVIAMLRDDDASRAVWLDPSSGAAHHMSPDAIAVEASTLTILWTRELAAALKERDLAFLDAPVVGSRPQADGGQLIQLIGGDKDVVARAVPIFEAFSSARYWCGSNGAGTAMKLAVNALFGIQVAALAELIAMVRSHGIAPAQAVDILGGLPVLSPAGKGAALSMVARNFAPMFPIELVEKDFHYAIAAAKLLGSPAPMTTSAHAIYATAMQRGFGAENIAGVSRLYEQPDE